MDRRVASVIDVYASQPNYWRHLAPVVRELCRRGHEVRTGASTMGKPWGDRWMRAPTDSTLMIVASHTDASRWPWLRCVYVEHGAGQTYIGQKDGYAGAEGLDNVVLFLAPNEVVAQRWRERYDVAVAVVGCPALDQFFDVTPILQDVAKAPVGDGGRAVDGLRTRGVPVVAVTSHWFCGVVPETMPVLPLYESALRSLCDAAVVSMVGHTHPRAWQRTRALWDRLGVPYEPDPDVLLRTADLLVADNTSLMYEAAAIDVPVLALNWPWNRKRNQGYRRDVEHGLRFWSHVPGLSCDTADELVGQVQRALEDPPEAKKLRADAATRAYAHRDGRSAARAADAIEELI